MHEIKFTEGNLEHILRSSEDFAIFGTRGTGHTGRKHVDITNAKLALRILEPGEFALKTAFLRFKDAVRAATLVLNSAEPQPRVFDFYQKMSDGDKLELKNVNVHDVFRMRYAAGPDATRVLETNYMTLIAIRASRRPFAMHVLTFFGSLPLYNA